ncbi:stage 0 sporulation regulatory protein [Bacillus ectoiniformans]|nr:stage 0 sporulation regulatory protein [Bacillus ectoiniformans]
MQIENCRREMVVLAMQTSYSDSKVIEASTKLDHLLNEYENLKKPEASAAC